MKKAFSQLNLYLLVTGLVLGSSDSIYASADMSGLSGTVAPSGNTQADPLTGGFTYAVPIKVAPGRQGAQPALALGYGSAGGNSWCGVGWSLDVGFIMRESRKGVPIQWAAGSATPLNQYDDEKGFIASIGGVSGRLVVVGPTNANPVIFRQEAETSFLTYKFYTNNYWEIVDKSGNTFYLGEGTTNRMENPKSGWTSGTKGSTYRWALNRIVDVNGNLTDLRYTTEGGQLYLTNIAYNANTNSPALTATHTVDFILTNRADTNISFQTGYKVETRKLLSEIQVKVSGNNVRKYVITYTNSPSTLRSLVQSVTEYGSDFSTALPSATFNYQVKPLEFAPATEWTNLHSQSISSNNASWFSVRGISDDAETHMVLIDIDADGLPDRVMRKATSPYTNYFMVQRNTGGGFGLVATNYQWGPLKSESADISWNNPMSVNDDGATHVDLVDINGDSYPDRVMRAVYPGPYTNFIVQLNSGVAGNAGFNNALNWGPVTNINAGPTSYNWRSVRFQTYVDFMDINGDGLPDRVSRKVNTPYTNGLEVQLNMGGGFQTPVNWSPLDSQGNTDPSWNSVSSLQNDDYRVTTLDINGDGLPDRVMRKETTPYTNFVVQFNNGAGFETATNWGSVDTQTNNTATEWGSPIASNGNETSALLVDMNGDGLADRVMRTTGSPYTNWVVQLNTGSGFAPPFRWLAIDSQGQPTSRAWNNISSRGSGNIETYVDLLDINGDGLPDRVMRKLAAPYDRYVVQLNKGPFPDLMSTISNGIGGVVQVSYIASTTLDNRDTNWVSDPWGEGTKSLMPYNTWVVSAVSVCDGMGKTNTTTTTYKGGYYNSQKREFRGFSQVEVTDPFGAKTRTYFHQSGGRDGSALGEYLDQTSVTKKGIPYRVEIIGSDGTTNKITLSKVEEVMLHTNGWYFPFVSQSIVLSYEGLSSYRATAKQLQYDTNSGNLNKDINFGEVTNVNLATHGFTDVGSDSVYTHYTYASISGIFNKLSNIKITSDSGGSMRLKESSMAYDSRGNITSAQVWLDTASAFVTLASTVYDQYGNPVQTTDAAGIATSVVYDSTYKQFGVTQITGTFTNQFVHDPKAGSLVQGIDPKGLVASNVYDVFFRPKECYISTTPNGAPTLWRSKMDYVSGGTGGGITTNYVRKRVYDAIDATNGYEAYSYFDGLGRGIQSRSEAENGGYRVSDAIYDERGNAKYQTLPYTNASAGFTTLSGTRLGTFTEYDTIGRAFKVTPAVEATFNSNRQMTSTNATGGDTGSPVAPVTTAFKDGSNPWASVVTDSENQVKKSYHDAYGRVVTITEITSGGNFNTTYKYDLLGNLTNVLDNANNPTLMVYDSMGRKISMVDSDMGTWSYTYDVSGKLTQQIDARTNKVKFYFSDELGRMSSKEIYNSANQLTGTTTYTYDSSDDVAYTVFKGDLYKVADREGWMRSSYDLRGRVLKSSRWLNLNSMEYVTQSTYDEADRVQTVIYPGNATTIKYTYDAAGNLSQVRSLSGTGTQEVFYASPTYNELGQLTSYIYGNGVVTTNSYYANSKRAQQIRAFVGATNHQDLTYTFDNVANLKSLTDGKYSGSASASLTNLTYDDLHRLTSLSSTARGSKSYSYDSIGNTLVNQDYGGSTYAYGAKPHAVTNANGKTYAYDACGNMITRGSQTLVYDEENRLIEVSNGGTNVTRFGYADSGERLWRSGTNGYSVWIGGIYEIDHGKVLCHVFASGERIATFEPQCGGMWSKVMGDERYYAFMGALDRGFNWPFQQGRTPYTMLTFTFAGMLCIALRAGKRVRLAPYELKRAWRTGMLWKQTVTFVSIAALILTTTQNVEAQVYPTVFHYYHSDHLGSSNVLTNPSGARLQHYEYAAFGKATYTEDSAAFPVSNRYTGQVLDEETGLCYYNARYYDPELGRFVQADTIVPSASNPQTLNRYSYCGNNPLKYTDPTGHDFGISAVIIGVIVGAAIGGATAAATGGNIGMGILTGAIGGLFGGLGAWAGSTIGAVGSAAATAGAFGGAVLGGAAGGAVSAAITGGDIGMGALTGAIGGAIGFGVGQLQIGLWGADGLNNWGDDLIGFATSAAGGALGGGIGAVLQGGDFWDGAMAGAIGGAIGYAIAVDLPDALKNATSENPRFHLFAAALLEAIPQSWLNNSADFFSGMSDAMTFNGSKKLRESLEITSGVVDYDSGQYVVGGVAGAAVGSAIPPAAFLRPFNAAAQPIVRWGGQIEGGKFVMTGGKSLVNYFKAGLPRGLKGYNGTVHTMTVPGSSLRYPSGWGSS